MTVRAGGAVEEEVAVAEACVEVGEAVTAGVEVGETERLAAEVEVAGARVEPGSGVRVAVGATVGVRAAVCVAARVGVELGSPVGVRVGACAHPTPAESTKSARLRPRRGP